MTSLPRPEARRYPPRVRIQARVSGGSGPRLRNPLSVRLRNLDAAVRVILSRLMLTGPTCLMRMRGAGIPWGLAGETVA
jgi:hypothetical protein